MVERDPKQEPLMNQHQTPTPTNHPDHPYLAQWMSVPLQERHPEEIDHSLVLQPRLMENKVNFIFIKLM